MSMVYRPSSFCFFRPASRSALEMKGAPPESWVEASDLTDAGTAEFCSTPVRNEPVRAAMTIAPVSAVPTEIPRLVIVFWSPPTSSLCSSETEETVMLPSCEARHPTPRPASSMGQVTISGPAPASRAATMTTRPANSATKPIWTTRRGEARGRNFGMPAAASKSVIESGNSRTPVSIADSPNATERNSGTAKNNPPCRRNWKKNEVRPPRSTGLRMRARSMSGSEPRAISRFSHVRNSHMTTPPPSISQMVGDRPSHSGAPGLGLTNPHVPERTIPNTTSPRPSAESAVPTRSSRTPARRVPSAIRRARARIPSTTRTSPANT